MKNPKRNEKNMEKNNILPLLDSAHLETGVRMTNTGMPRNR